MLLGLGRRDGIQTAWLPGPAHQTLPISLRNSRPNQPIPVLPIKKTTSNGRQERTPENSLSRHVPLPGQLPLCGFQLSRPGFHLVCPLPGQLRAFESSESSHTASLFEG